MLLTIIARCVNEDGDHVQAVYASVPEEQVDELTELVNKNLTKTAKRAFGDDFDGRPWIAVLPYVPQLDDEQDDDEV